MDETPHEEAKIDKKFLFQQHPYQGFRYFGTSHNKTQLLITVELKPEFYSWTTTAIRIFQKFQKILFFFIVFGFFIKMGLKSHYFSELPRNVLDDVSEQAELKKLVGTQQTLSETFFCWVRDLKGWKFLTLFAGI